MTGGQIGNGTRVFYAEDTSPFDWQELGQLLDVTVPGLNPDEVETTVHSTQPWKRFIRGMIDVGELGLMILQDLDSATSPDQRKLFDLQAAGTTVQWRIEIPVDRDLATTDYAAIEFAGWVKKWSPKTPIAGRQELEASVRFDGDSFSLLAAGNSVGD